MVNIMNNQEKIKFVDFIKANKKHFSFKDQKYFPSLIEHIEKFNRFIVSHLDYADVDNFYISLHDPDGYSNGCFVFNKYIENIELTGTEACKYAHDELWKIICTDDVTSPKHQLFENFQSYFSMFSELQIPKLKLKFTINYLVKTGDSPTIEYLELSVDGSYIKLIYKGCENG